MIEVYGLPQPLTGNEIVTLYQMQNGQLAKCMMPLSDLVALVISNLASITTAEPTAKGVVWNNAGSISVS